MPGFSLISAFTGVLSLAGSSLVVLAGFTFGQSLRSCPVFLVVPERLVAYLERSGSADRCKHPPALLGWTRSQGCPPSKGDFLLARMIVSPEGCAAWIYCVGRSARVRLREMTFVGGFWFARGIGYSFAWLTSSCLAPLDAFARLSSLPSASRLAARVEGEFCFGGSCPRKNLF